ncbi:ADP-ribosylglycohydrolase family protein [Fibrella sp. HMF5335]|uniref:ADP-ribosylglycohydrolase family protein n=1 Tax=Fibrella rubiginis TaxID=2817060 RepID=A0A939GJC9_9BACT|nr:ADP-ribosylglycohydrolase family protein [Fibrella rubiginis]MBO0938324.1 ADP-ribosylglycohydrolase family protein [Fibrella rubiginis]
MKTLLLVLSLLALTAFGPTPQLAKTVVLSKAMLQDKINGGWAGQVIGCTFGGPTEFRFQGTMINDYQPIPWYDGYIKKTMIDIPGLYDDIYMDLTFVDVFEKEGLDAPAAAHAKAYANADYMLWHANQIGRYNILHGIMPPQSGHWLNNPQADAIDYQIEADFAGLMSPGMPNTASRISDKIGHIMNYGDGYYGGVYMGAMYSLAFVSNDVNYIVTEGLKTIPKEANFYKCIADVIRWHRQYPADWKQAWLEIQKKWADDKSCPEGIFSTFNIDASLNAAYVVMGLLYGNGDYTRTLEIATRCGQDSDCNPASAGGILGTMLGYSKIPARWKMGLAEAEDLDFKYTTMSLNDVYALGMKHALQVVERYGGKVVGDQVTIVQQTPSPVALEQGFVGHFPVDKRTINKALTNELTLDFEGIGFVLNGSANRKTSKDADHDFRADLYIDGQKAETILWPTADKTRRFNLAWKYQLPRGKHQLRVVLQNPVETASVNLSYLVVFDDKPVSVQY